MIKEYFSNTLERNVALTCFEQEVENGRKIIKVNHESLVQLYNELRRDGTITVSTFDFDPVTEFSNMANLKAVFKCKLTIDGYEYFSIGETCQENLSNAVSKMYPVLMAMYRGFDLCFKQYLSLSESIYTDAEIIDAVDTKKQPAKTKSEPKKQEEPKESKQEKAPNEEQITKTNSVKVEVEDAKPEPEIDLSTGVQTQPQVDTENSGEYKMPFGNHKGKTLKEILKEEKGRDYLEYLLKQDWLKEDTSNAIKAALGQ